MIIDLLMKILPHQCSSSSYSTQEWTAVESRFCISLPQEFKDIVSEFGSGCVDDFIWLLNPFSENDNLNFNAAEYFIDAYKQLAADFPEYYQRASYPENGSFFPWAVTDNGETFVWIIDKNRNPDEWAIAILSNDQGEEELYELSTIEFLTALLDKKIVSSILPEQFPSDNVTFTAI